MGSAFSWRRIPWRWDWPWIQEIFHAGAWPANLDGQPLLLNINHLNDYVAFQDAVEKAFTSGLRRHHALDDAKANRLGWIAAGGLFREGENSGQPTRSV